jgi:hypothetical protein
MNVPDTILTKIKVTLYKDKNLSSMYPLVSKLYSIAVIQPLSTAEVERLYSHVALIKTSHRANIKTETLSKIRGGQNLYKFLPLNEQSMSKYVAKASISV